MMRQTLLVEVTSRGPAALAVLLGLLLSAGARADVVGPPPPTCPAGSEPASCHGGPYCSPLRCTDTRACAGPTSCQSVKLCVSKISCVGMWPGGDAAKPPPNDNIKGACPASGSCAEGTCESISICLPPGGGPPSSTDDGCSCALGAGRASGGAGLLGLLGLLGAALLLRLVSPGRPPTRICANDGTHDLR